MDALTEGRSKPRRWQGITGMHRLLRTLLSCLAALALLGMLLPLQRAWFPSNDGLAWALDLFAHWQPWYAVAWGLSCTLMAIGQRRWLWALPVAALPWLTASRPATEALRPTELVVVVANVNIHQRDPHRLLEWLRTHPANIVVLTELSPTYAKQLAAAANGGFSHAAIHAQDSPPGLGILSDRPLHDQRLHSDALGALHLETRIVLHGQSIRLIAVHPKPPMAVRKFRARDQLLRELAQSTTHPLIVAGDLNATPWSSALYAAQRHQLLRVTGSAPTYPSEGAGLIGIGIDHVLVSPQLAGTFRQRGPDIGSDHLPVRAGLAWHSAPARSAAGTAPSSPE